MSFPIRAGNDRTTEYFGRGVILASKEQYRKALKCFDKVLSIAPKHLDALNGRADCLALLGHHTQAIASYDKLLAARPGDLHARGNRASALKSIGRLAEAVADYGAVLQSAPDYVEALFNRGNMGVLAEEGISAERVAVLKQVDRAGHFTAYRDIDIALDPFPHGGGMTTLESLWMGVPVVTAPGRIISSRLAAAILTAVGLTDFIATDRQRYVQLAAAKASELGALAQLRSTLRHRLANTEFGDAVRYARAVERHYRSMWQEWCGERAAQGAQRPAQA